MASGPGIGFSPRLTAALAGTVMVLAACLPSGGAATSTSATPALTTQPTTGGSAGDVTTAPTTTSAPPTPTTTPVATTTTPTTTNSTLAPSTTAPSLPDIDAEVRLPEGEGPFPAVVLVHGGGWVAGSPSAMRPLAAHLTGAGFLTVNTRYRLSNDGPGYPRALEDVACAVRYAAAHPDSDGTVAVVGYSAGAHLGSVVALDGDSYTDNCTVAGSGVPDKFVGLAGLYDVERLGILMIPFFGAGPDEVPEAWESANPLDLVGQNPALTSLLMYGDEDGIVPYSFTADFDRALRDAGADSLIEIVEGARHLDMQDPELVGDLIVVWLER